jgi:hypothetical protein
VPNRDDVLREWWEQLSREVGRVVEEVDPEGLLAIGAPSGEYDSEADEFTSLIVHGNLSEQTVLAVWEERFGPGSHLAEHPDVLASLTSELLKVSETHPRP